MSETVVAPEQVEVEASAEPARWSGQSLPRKEDKRLVQGQGVFVDDIKRQNMGYAHFARSPYAACSAPHAAGSAPAGGPPSAGACSRSHSAASR